LWPICKALLAWGKLELFEGWRTWFRKPKAAESPAKQKPETAMPALSETPS
jgi:hypothetical protein